MFDYLIADRYRGLEHGKSQTKLRSNETQNAALLKWLDKMVEMCYQGSPLRDGTVEVTNFAG